MASIARWLPGLLPIREISLRHYRRTSAADSRAPFSTSTAAIHFPEVLYAL